ncbi:MAG: tRNA glutamyl-Q(34) synthetase GluQRS [Rhodobacterales bacterium]|nr:tRNA glutamyl-Q(34) synthetase GluQRS [Rhodobacterales bacterium]
MIPTTRFAPSPTGPLHLGHAYSAILAHDMAAAQKGRFLLRIEDIDQSRSRPAWEAQIFDDLAWLGLSWPQPVMRQSARINIYQAAITRLWRRGLLYPCTCTRRDIAAAAAAPQEGAPLVGPDGTVYPGTCRPGPAWCPPISPPPAGTPLRLDMRRAEAALGHRNLTFNETGAALDGRSGAISIAWDEVQGAIGDIVLARPAMATSYHLSVVLDDAAQGITLVPRGTDLFDATVIHLILQHLLELPTPVYHHHRLIRDDTGKRLAKRDDARSIRTYRHDGATAQDIRRLIGLP